MYTCVCIRVFKRVSQGWVMGAV